MTTGVLIIVVQLSMYTLSHTVRDR